MTIKFEKYTELPKQTRNSNSRRRGLVREIAENLKTPNDKAIIPIELNMVEDENGNQVPESFEKAVSRITSKLYVKNAFPFPIAVRRQADGPNTVTVYRLSEEETQS